MKKIAFAALVAISTTSAFALEIPARKFDGEDGATSPASCAYYVQDQQFDTRYLLVGLRASNAGDDNMGFGVPKDMLPLKDGASYTDNLGYQVTYSNGVLHASFDREYVGYTEHDTIELTVSPDLRKIVFGSLARIQEAPLSYVPRASMECEF